MKQGAKPALRHSFDDLVQRNIETVAQIENAAHESRSRSDHIADAVSAFCGSMAFVWVHCIWFGSWLLVNGTQIFPKSVRFDAPPFGVLTLVVSLEAIFLSTFILISQNRQQRLADKRNMLDLQINLLAEQESSQLLDMMEKVMTKLGLTMTEPEDTEALKQPTDPKKLADKLEETVETIKPPNSKTK